MQIDTILQLFNRLLQIEIAKLTKELSETWDFRKFEDELMKVINQLEAVLTMCVLEECLSDPDLLKRLKVLGGKLGMHFKEYRTLNIRLRNGLQVRVTTPYFLKTKAKRGRKKKGPNGRGKHLGLEVLGILGKVSPALASKTVSMALLCPSLEVAKTVLGEQGVAIDVKTLRRYCQVVGGEGLKWRGLVSMEGTEQLEGVTVVVGIDGGRLRQRKRKRGRRKKGQKRSGYHTDWREPKLFTIYFLDAQGEVIREMAPLHDATMGNHEAAFALLEQYLTALPLAQAEKIVFCGDGAPWIWNDVLTLCQRLQLDMSNVYQVLDYTHAKQQLNSLLDYVGKRGGHKRQQGKLDSKWKNLLWNGQIDDLKTEIETHCVGQRKAPALKKWHTYFQQNAHRMTYHAFETHHIPCGSGCVESAIRRVINLRLKAPGTFWTIEMAELFLFLRSQLISGRWSIMMRNVTRQMARMLQRVHDDSLNVELFQPPLIPDELPLLA